MPFFVCKQVVKTRMQGLGAHKYAGTIGMFFFFFFFLLPFFFVVDISRISVNTATATVKPVPFEPR
jgi:hypothetical protein